MYYHRIIVNFRKLSYGNKFFLHILVNIPQEGTDLAAYPWQFSGVYSGALAREARSGAPWVTKCGKLPIRENLVIT